MASKNAGEARVSIVPDTSGFLKKLEADLKAKRYEYKLPVDADTSQAERETERFRQEQKRKPFETQLDIDVKNAEDKLRALRIREEAKKLGMTVNVDADTRRAKLQLDLLRAEAESRRITVRLDADASGFKAALDKIANDTGGGGGGGGFGSALFGGGLTSPGGIGAIIGLLPALSSGVVDVVAAIQQLAQAGLALPGIFASIGADVGVVKLATDGVSDAFTAVEKASDGSAKNIQAANDALSKLAPQAADFVREVSALKPAFDGLQKGVQGNFFDGLGKSVKTLVDADLPVLQQGLGGIATAMNDNLKQLGVSLGSDSSKGLLDRILGNTGDAQSRLSAAIDPIVAGLGHLAAAGTDVLPRLSDDIARVSERFSSFITSADQSGALDKWINDGITGFEHLGSTLLNVGKSITDITGAVDGDLLQGLDNATQKFETFLSSPQGQQDLRQFLDEGNQQLHMMGDILGNLGPEFKDAFHGAATGVHEVLAALDGVTSSLRWMQDNIPGVSQALKSLTDPTGAVSDILNVLNGPTPREAAQAKLDAARSHLPGGDVKPAVGGAPGAAIQPPSLPGTAVAPPGTYTPGQNPLLLPGHATGGVLPGYSPGKDNMLVPLAGGEGIVRPEAVRKYGPGVIHMLNQGFAPGGIVPDYISIATGGSGGAAPGPIAPNPAQGGIGSIAQSFLSGLGGPIGNLGGLFGGANGSSDSGTTLTPGLAGLFQAGSNPDLLGQWGQQTGDWLGGFAAKTLTSFGTALWQGVLGFFGLGNSILSPTNPYIQDALKGAGFLLGDSGPFAGKGGSSKKGATEKQLREGGQKIDRADQKVALIQQRIAELKPDAKQSQRDSLANQLANAQQDAADARSDFAALQSGSGSSSTGQVPLGTTPPGTGASRWTPVIQQALADVGPKYGITNIPAWTKALEGQIQFESGGDPTIDNPRDSDGQPALGLGQFKQGTFNAHNITGGDVHDGTAAIYAMIDYVASRYGQNSAGVPNGINQGHGYATGGGVDTVPAMLTPGEHVLTTDDVAAMGGQAGVYRFRQALHGYDIGGQVYGGNFNPGVRIDTSTSSVAPPFDPNSLQFGDLLKITGALGPDDIGEQAIHKDHWVPGRDPWLSYGQGINNRPAVPDGKGFSDPNVNPWIAHMAIGGEVYPFPDALTPLPPRPSPDAQKVNRPNPTPAPVVPRPPVVQRPPVVVAPPPVEPPPPAQPEQRPYQPGPAPVGASDGSVKSHTLPAISKGITSGFATAGSLAQTAAAIGSFGAAGAAGGIGAGIGGGGGGPSISGLFQQFGKIANDIVDVGSAFLVGNVTGGTTANAYGETLRPAQNVPLTAPLNQQRTYNIQAGYKPYDLVDALNLMDSQHNQAALAGYRG